MRWLRVSILSLPLSTAAVAQAVPTDPVLRWNEVALEVVAEDHSGTFGAPEQGSPTRAARALAIVHAAIHDAVSAIDGSYEPYHMQMKAPPHTSIDAAVARAGHDTLVALYPAQHEVFAVALAQDLASVPDARERRAGERVGAHAAHHLLHSRRADGSQAEVVYTPGDLPGQHRVDPLHPAQGFLTPGWGAVTPFVLPSGDALRSPPPPALGSAAYAAAFLEVKDFGVATESMRTPDQTEIGIYWAYDGTRGLGPPPRLYNQIVRGIAEQMDNDVVENARLFALVNLAMADAGIACWETKYVYNFWRPVLGVREADPDTGPSGLGDGNPFTSGDTDWTPLGAPASNQSGTDFTPPFPAYPSGHATFGAALFRMLERFYGTDDVAFSFVSDELNGVTTDSAGGVRA
ncbi:MAG: vanadium-dependent haloperoxidase, partial [Myxococcota bacterium]